MEAVRSETLVLSSKQAHHVSGNMVGIPVRQGHPDDLSTFLIFAGISPNSIVCHLWALELKSNKKGKIYLFQRSYLSNEFQG